MTRFGTLLATCLLVSACAAPLSAKVTDVEIQAAIDRGVERLLNTQTDKGWWTPNGAAGNKNTYNPKNPQVFGMDPFNGGDEACVMMALAYAGIELNHPKMKKGLNALLDFKMARTYNCALRIMALSKMWPHMGRELRERAKPIIMGDAAFLVKVQLKSGAWNYPRQIHEFDPIPSSTDDDVWDFSNTQMAILGLSEAINTGLELQFDPFIKAQDLYLKRQELDGGWNYCNKGLASNSVGLHSYGAMTAAGVASLFLTRDYIYRGVGCPCANGRSANRPTQVDSAIERGMEWLAKRFSAEHQPSASGKTDIGLDNEMVYWLYSCERAALASGYKYFGTHDWYAEGADYIIKHQCADGSGGQPYNRAFALCFLIKGQAPILFNKLQFKGLWNQHPRDVANLVKYLGSQEKIVQWQIINPDVPVAEWHDAPILYITAESALNFTVNQRKKLREFTDTGGTVLFEASCGNGDAATAWKQLALEVWPEWEMKQLTADHPLFSADQKIAAKTLPTFYGMDDGLRTFAIISLTDISCAWNTTAVTRQLPLFDLGGNLFRYTTDRRPLRARLATTKTFTRKNYTDEQPTVGVNPTLKAARLKHGGDWTIGQNYAALDKLAAAVTDKAPQLKLEVGPPVAPADLAASGIKVAHLIGRKGVNFSDDAQVAALKKFLESGGLLLAEAAMGDTRFDPDFVRLVAQLGLQVKELDAAAPLLSGRLDPATGYTISGVRYRFALQAERVGKPLPLLKGLYLGDKLVGVYSPFDLTFSATGYDAWGCRGYDREDALAILTNILLLASTR